MPSDFAVTINLTSLPLYLAMVGIRTHEITVQVRDRNLHTTNQLSIAHEQMRNEKTLF